jgi:hypothetical protein
LRSSRARQVSAPRTKGCTDADGLDGASLNRPPRGRLELWLDGVEQSYGVLPADAAIFRRWAQLMHRRPDHHLGDALIAATALVRGLTVVSRNVHDFERLRRSLDQSIHLIANVATADFVGSSKNARAPNK